MSYIASEQLLGNWSLHLRFQVLFCILVFSYAAKEFGAKEEKVGWIHKRKKIKRDKGVKLLFEKPLPNT